MKKVIILALIFLTSVRLPAQQDSLKGHYDKDFVKKYRKIALGLGPNNTKVIRKWKSDIKIYITGDSLNKIRTEVEKYIKVLNPSLNKIKIQIVDNKDEANFLILIKNSLVHIDKKNDDFRFNSSSDDSYVIYKSSIEISKELTSLSEQRMQIQKDILYSLGFSSCKDLDKNKIDCKICFTTSELTDFDLQAIKVHYSDLINVGMNEEDVTKALLDSISYIELKNEKVIYNSISKTFKVSYNPNDWKCWTDTLKWDVVFKSSDNLLTVNGKEFLTKINEENIESFYKNSLDKARFKLKSFDFESQYLNGQKIYVIDYDCESIEPQFKGILYHAKIYHYFDKDKSFELIAFTEKRRFHDSLIKIYELIKTLTK